MEATIAAPKVKAPHKSSGNEATAVPPKVAEHMANGKDRAPEQTLETKMKTPGTSGVLRMETTKASTSDAIARAAEKVASSQIAIVLQSARAELKQRRSESWKQKDHCLHKLEDNEINEKK